MTPAPIDAPAAWQDAPPDGPGRWEFLSPAGITHHEIVRIGEWKGAPAVWLRGLDGDYALRWMPGLRCRRVS